MKYLFTFLIIIFNMAVMGQNQNVGIGTSLPDASALLDLSSTTKGLLIPRMTTGQRTTFATVIKGLTVFDITTNSFWFYDGTAWVELPGANKIWKLDGNAGTNATVNFIGTTDAEPLVFKVNNLRAGFIYSSNTALGYQTFTNNTSGFSNSAFGYKTLSLNNTGYQNTAVGHSSLSDNTAGNENCAIGNSALRDNINGSGNCAVGILALSKNKYGDKNVAVGSQALFNNTYGSNLVAIGKGALHSTDGWGLENTAIGYEAMYSTSSGDRNTAIGFSSMRNNIDGLWNTATGDSSLTDNIDGSFNNAYGKSALRNNTSGNYNCAFGLHTLYANTTGFYNTSIGDRTMTINTSGAYNVAVGAGALDLNTTGSYNIGIGYNTNVQTNNLTNATAIGYGALVNASNSMRFGNSIVTKWGFGRNVTTGVLQVGDDATNGNGAYLSAGGTWVNTSDAHKKENFEEVDGKELLETIMQLPITKWNYKGQASAPHIGPMAQDFYKLFNVGDNNTSISSVDPSGIALRAIQELIKENAALKQQMEELKKNCVSASGLQQVPILAEAMKDQQMIIQKQQSTIEDLIKRIEKIESQFP